MLRVLGKDSTPRLMICVLELRWEGLECLPDLVDADALADGIKLEGGEEKPRQLSIQLSI